VGSVSYGVSVSDKLEAGRPRSHPKEIIMTLTATHLSPIIALIAGILILILPHLLNYVVAIYLIVIGLIGLNGIYHFIN
jgi:hypothetical protein